MKLDRFYSIDESEDGIVATLKPESLISKVSFVITIIAFVLPLVFLAVIGIIKGHIFFAIVGSAFSPLLLVYILRGRSDWNKLKVLFKFTISKKGVTINDMGGTQTILWEDVHSYGIMNHIIEQRPVKYARYQACIYILNSALNEETLRKSLEYWNDKNSSTPQMIVFPFYLPIHITNRKNSAPRHCNHNC